MLQSTRSPGTINDVEHAREPRYSCELRLNWVLNSCPSLEGRRNVKLATHTSRLCLPRTMRTCHSWTSCPPGLSTQPEEHNLTHTARL
jgi:hypothetical protein